MPALPPRLPQDRLEALLWYLGTPVSSQGILGASRELSGVVMNVNIDLPDSDPYERLLSLMTNARGFFRVGDSITSTDGNGSYTKLTVVGVLEHGLDVRVTRIQLGEE